MHVRQMTTALISGTLFGAGLALSGMTNPNKILNFLDITGRWDPSLALVMTGAIPVASFGFWWARRRKQPLFAEQFTLTQRTRIEPLLLIGAALFGIGWGLGGYCPGPAVASLSRPTPSLVGFLIAMAAGLSIAALIRKFGSGASPDPADVPAATQAGQ